MSETSKKFCPLGFFSFYVNKKEAQAGGGHHCVEESCAIWNDEYQECSLKMGLDAITSLAENFGTDQPKMMPSRIVETPKLSVFDRLRKRTEGQKLPTVDAGATISAQPPLPPPAPAPAPAAPSVTPSAAPAAAPSLGLLSKPQLVASLPTIPSLTPPTTPISQKDELLKPPDVPLSELPVISVSIEEA